MTKILDESAIDTFVEFALKLLSYIEDVSVAEDLPNLQDVRVSFTEQGWSHNFRHRPSPHHLKVRCLSEDSPIWSMPEASRCARILLAGGILKERQLHDSSGGIDSPSSDKAVRVAIPELVGLVMTILYDVGTVRPSREQILDSYLPYVYMRLTSEERSEIRVQCTIPLLNFEAEVWDITLGQRLQLTHFSPEEKLQYGISGHRAATPYLMTG